MVCFGSRALLSLFVAAAPYPESLEAVDGLSLVRHAHAELPDLRTLLILQSSSLEALRRGDCLGLVPAAIAPKQLA